MNSLIQALGLDLKILLAQFINFSVLIFVLWRFAYKPVFNILEERRKKIAKGIQDSEEAEIKLQEAENHKKEIITEARREANLIIEEAKLKAETRYQEIVGRSKEDVRGVIAEEKSKIETEKNLAIIEIKKRIAELTILAVEKILAEKIDDKKDADLITKVVKDL